MRYDEFSAKLDSLIAEFRRAHGRDMKTIDELRAFLDRRLARPKKRGARSLRGIFG